MNSLEAVKESKINGKVVTVTAITTNKSWLKRSFFEVACIVFTDGAVFDAM
jgi:hypothetical protein